MPDVTHERILEVLREELVANGNSIDIQLATEIFELESRAQFTADRNEVNRRVISLIQSEIERRLD